MTGDTVIVYQAPWNWDFLRNRSKIKPRLERAAQSFEQGDHEFASEVLSELLSR